MRGIAVFAGALVLAIVAGSWMGAAFAQTASPPLAEEAKTEHTASTPPATDTPAETKPAAAKPKTVRRRPPPPQDPSLADGFARLFGGAPSAGPPQRSTRAAPAARRQNASQIMMQRAASSYATSKNALAFGLYRITPREEIAYRDRHAPGTIIVRQREKRLYFVLGNGRALRYAIAVGREGTSWSGVSAVSDKREWPAWTPTPNILKKQPDLPRYVEGGPANPLGARALYLGQTMYRIHGTNEPWRIGEDVSSGCIRLTNDDIIDLYNRARIGATVIVQR